MTDETMMLNSARQWLAGEHAPRRSLSAKVTPEKNFARHSTEEATAMFVCFLS